MVATLLFKTWFLIFLSVKMVAGEPMFDALTNPFVIEKETVDELTAKYGITVQQLLHELVPFAKRFARPPISRYHVGISGLGKSGAIYLGVNLEFPGLPLSQSVHGEQFLVANARKTILLLSGRKTWKIIDL